MNENDESDSDSFDETDEENTGLKISSLSKVLCGSLPQLQKTHVPILEQIITKNLTFSDPNIVVHQAQINEYFPLPLRFINSIWMCSGLQPK